jgi:RHS repeat-associated protein
VDEDDPPNTTTQSWSFTVPPLQRSFEYDASGNCPSLRSRPAKSLRIDDAAIAAKQWHDNEIVRERVGTSATAGTISRNHFFGGFTVGATVGTAAKYQTLTDHLGNVRELVAITASPAAPTGTVVTRYDYTAYQRPEKVHQHPGTNVEATFQTIGRYYHHEPSGLELALYRAYDPELGRWISEDPIGEEGGLNLYGFVGNGPIIRKDDFGLHPAIAGHVGGGALVGAGGGYLVGASYELGRQSCAARGKQNAIDFDEVHQSGVDGILIGTALGAFQGPAAIFVETMFLVPLAFILGSVHCKLEENKVPPFGPNPIP